MRKVLFIIAGVVTGWIITSVIGGIALGIVWANTELSQDVEVPAVALTVIGGMVIGGVVGARLAERRRAPHSG